MHSLIPSKHHLNFQQLDTHHQPIQHFQLLNNNTPSSKNNPNKKRLEKICYLFTFQIYKHQFLSKEWPKDKISAVNYLPFPYHFLAFLDNKFPIKKNILKVANKAWNCIVSILLTYFSLMKLQELIITDKKMLKHIICF